MSALQHGFLHPACTLRLRSLLATVALSQCTSLLLCLLATTHEVLLLPLSKHVLVLLLSKQERCELFGYCCGTCLLLPGKWSWL